MILSDIAMDAKGSLYEMAARMYETRLTSPFPLFL